MNTPTPLELLSGKQARCIVLNFPNWLKLSKKLVSAWRELCHGYPIPIYARYECGFGIKISDLLRIADQLSPSTSQQLISSWKIPRDQSDEHVIIFHGSDLSIIEYTPYEPIHGWRAPETIPFPHSHHHTPSRLAS